jgi:hypothetical protein
MSDTEPEFAMAVTLETVADAFGTILDVIGYLEDQEESPFMIEPLIMRDLGRDLLKLKPQLWDAYQALLIVDQDLALSQPIEPGSRRSPSAILQARRIHLGLGFMPCQHNNPTMCFKTALLGVRHCREHASEEEIAEAADNQDKMISAD